MNAGRVLMTLKRLVLCAGVGGPGTVSTSYSQTGLPGNDSANLFAFLSSGKRTQQHWAAGVWGWMGWGGVGWGGVNSLL